MWALNDNFLTYLNTYIKWLIISLILELYKVYKNTYITWLVISLPELNGRIYTAGITSVIWPIISIQGCVKAGFIVLPHYHWYVHMSVIAIVYAMEIEITVQVFRFHGKFQMVVAEFQRPKTKDHCLQYTFCSWIRTKTVKYLHSHTCLKGNLYIATTLSIISTLEFNYVMVYRHLETIMSFDPLTFRKLSCTHKASNNLADAIYII